MSDHQTNVSKCVAQLKRYGTFFTHILSLHLSNVDNREVTDQILKRIHDHLHNKEHVNLINVSDQNSGDVVRMRWRSLNGDGDVYYYYTDSIYNDHTTLVWVKHILCFLTQTLKSDQSITSLEGYNDDWKISSFVMTSALHQICPGTVGYIH